MLYVRRPNMVSANSILTSRRSFHQILHDRQFAVLGLTLLAVLARVKVYLRRILESGPISEGPSDANVAANAISASGISEDIGRPVLRVESNSHDVVEKHESQD